MEMTPWLIWLISAIILLVIEVFSGAVVALCLAVGCLLAIVPASIDSAVVVQFVVASIGAVAAFFILFPIIRKYKLNKVARASELSNIDAIVGRTGIVTENINADGRHGRVKIDGDSWLATADARYCPIESGVSIEVVAFDSIVLKVKPKNVEK